MDLTNWILTILIIIIIFSFNLYIVFVSMYDDINDNWAEYKCNPSVMPFADVFGHDTVSNFYGCVQNTQQTFTKYMLTPVNHGMSMLADAGADFQTTLQSSRTFISTIRDKVASIVEFVYGAFLNTIIEFQRLTISMKDLFFKIMGVVVTFLYFVDGSIKALTSLWKGPVGGAIRTVGKFRIPRIRFPRIRFPRFCFSGKNRIILDDGQSKSLYNLEVGDVLQNNNKVLGRIIVLNDIEKDLYMLGNTVTTGTHKVYIDNNESLVEVSRLNKSSTIKNNNDNYLYNFVTEKGYLNFGDSSNFCDWNEFTPNELSYLYNYAEIKDYNYENTKKEVLNEFNEFYYKKNMFNKETLIDVSNGKTKISDIKPGMVLKNDIIVVGVVSMKFNEDEDYFYHLITDEKEFNIDNKCTKDFNSIFDKILNIV